MVLAEVWCHQLARALDFTSRRWEPWRTAPGGSPHLGRASKHAHHAAKSIGITRLFGRTQGTS
jgi:hypothetical protein